MPVIRRVRHANKMSSPKRMRMVIMGLAILCGATFMATFLIVIGPDDLTLRPVQIWSWIILFPISLIATLITTRGAGHVFCAILSGIWAGTCATLLAAYTSSANLFPIVAALWTVLAIPSVASGAIVGWIVHYIRCKLCAARG